MSIKEVTIEWWAKCLNDTDKLNRWLVSLYNNEKDAEDRFIDFANTYCGDDKDAYNVFLEIAEQERQHAVLVKDLAAKRGVEIYEQSSKDGRYWSNVLQCAKDLKTSAAVGAYAESLSLGRMRVIIAEESTPEDIREMFKVIEPEESYHAEELARIAGKYGMSEVKECHDDGLEALGLKMIE